MRLWKANMEKSATIVSLSKCGFTIIKKIDKSYLYDSLLSFCQRPWRLLNAQPQFILFFKFWLILKISFYITSTVLLPHSCASSCTGPHLPPSPNHIYSSQRVRSSMSSTLSWGKSKLLHTALWLAIASHHREWASTS